MVSLVFSTGDKFIFNPCFIRQTEGIPDAVILGIHAQNTSQQGLVGTVALIGHGKGAIQDKLYLFRLAFGDLSSHQRNTQGTGGVRTGRPDHIGANHIEYTDFPRNILLF